MIFSWNIRGLNGHKKRRVVAQWLSFNKPLIGGLLETRVREDNLLSLLATSLHGWSYESNNSQTALNGRIVLIWNPSLSVVTYQKNDPYVLCGVFNPASNQSFTIVFVYAKN